MVEYAEFPPRAGRLQYTGLDQVPIGLGLNFPNTTTNISLPTLSTSHTIDQNDPFVWEKTFRGWDQGHDTLESWHETRHSLTSHYICQDTTLLHYLQTFPPDDVIDLETCNVLKRCTRVGRAAWLLWKEIILLFKACTPQ